MADLLKEFIKPELLILVPVLYLIGIGLKKSTVKDKLIPALLGGAGILSSLAWVLGTCEILSWARRAAGGVQRGDARAIPTAGASVYVNQVAKQGSKRGIGYL